MGSRPDLQVRRQALGLLEIGERPLPTAPVESLVPLGPQVHRRRDRLPAARLGRGGGEDLLQRTDRV